MNNISFKVKNSKKAVTPVIATIILIAATIVLALVVGAYTFGLFSSNVKTINLTAATLYSGTLSTLTAQGTANLALSMQNPGGATSISSIAVTGGGLNGAPTVYQCSSATVCAAISSPAVAPNGVTNFNTATTAFYFSVAITSGNTYNYVITFTNGQSASGSLIAQ